MFGFFLYSYYVGSILIENGDINPATGEVYSVVEIIYVSQATMMHLMRCGSVFPLIPDIIKALSVGKQVFDVIERVPKIASPAQPKADADQINISKGISFKDVFFRYPTAPETSRNVFEGVNFTI